MGALLLSAWIDLVSPSQSSLTGFEPKFTPIYNNSKEMNMTGASNLRSSRLTNIPVGNRFM
jgi:hypothetical protein